MLHWATQQVKEQKRVPGTLILVPDKVAMFVAYMDSVDHARATIRTYMSAFSCKHKLLDRWSAPMVNHSMQSWHKTWHFEQGKFPLLFVSFKHHKGSAMEIRILRGASPDVCPSAMLRVYAKHRPGQWTGPLFVWKSGEQVEAREPTTLLNDGRGGRSGPVTTRFRIGAVSNAAGRGASEAQLRMMGRWRSNTYMRFVRPSQRMPLH